MADFSPSVFAARRERLTDLLAGRALLVSNLVNVRYLTGFSGSNGFLLFSGSEVQLLTDGRYTTQVAQECPQVPAVIRAVDGTMHQLIAEAFSDFGLKECLIESGSMTVAMWRELEKSIGQGVALVDSSNLVENLRAIKDDIELDLIRCSVRINEQSLLATIENASPSWSELQFARHLEQEIRQRAGDGFSFDPIVAAGPSSALPHYHAGQPTLGDHDFSLVDWGSSYRGYASDLTRMLAIGPVPAQIKEIHSIVSAAKQAAAAEVRAGAELKSIDEAARNSIAEAGYGEFFNHGTGHGFGLEIHETPFLSPGREGELKTGMVITIEPGIYLPELGGVRLEDDYLVTATGSERLSTLSDDFLSL